MKKLSVFAVLAAVLTVSFTSGLWATPFDDFKKQIIGDTKAQAGTELKPFAKDLGGLIGGADFNSGRSLSFPGFDVGLTGTVQSKPSSDDVLLKNAKVNSFGVPMLQGAVALPIIGTDVMVRGITYSGFSVIGGGLRYPIFKSGTLTKFIPDISASAFYDSINFKYFTGTHMSADVAASYDLPIIKPFAGIGYDRTKLKVTGVSTGPTGLNGIDATSSKLRYTIGAKIIPFPLLYVFGAYTILHSETGFNVGAGVRF